MKKIVPDPPRPRLTNSPYSTIDPDIIPPDALAVASDLLCGVVETIDEYCRANAGQPGLHMLSNVIHSADTARALVEHALGRL